MTVKRPTKSVLGLRQRAGENVNVVETKASQPCSPETVERSFHELQVHQIELETQNKQLAQAYSELNRYKSVYETLFNQSAFGIAFVNAHDCKFVNVNQKFGKLLGYEKGEMTGLDLLSIIFEENRKINRDKYSQLLSGEIEEIFIDERFYHKDGHTVWLNISVSTLHLPESDQQLYAIMAKDISERKKQELNLQQAHEDLQKSNEILSDILENITDWIWEIDAENRVIYCSSQVEKHLGYLPAEIIGKTPFDFMSPQETERIGKLFQKIAHNKERILDMKTWLISKTGRPVLHLSSAAPVLDSAGNLKGYRGANKNIAKLRNYETELRKLSSAVNQAPVSIMITDEDEIIEFVNPKFCEVTGYTTAEVIGIKPSLLKSGNTPPETYRELWTAINDGNIWEGEFINKRKDGSIFYERAIISALRDDMGAITHYLSVKEDITDKKKLAEQMLHAQKLESIGQLASGLAHDLNNILTVINGYAALLQLRASKKLLPDVKEIQDASSRAATLVRSLLAYSRKQEMDKCVQNLNQLVETVGMFIKRIINENIEFTVSLPDKPLTVNVDTVQIEQVLLNLATNARDAMPDGGSFSISLADGDIDKSVALLQGLDQAVGYAIITVSDTGHGIDDQNKHKVFDPFFTTKDVDKGTGLGLSMAMGIMKQHNGYIDMQSETGKGSVFILYLPLVDDKYDEELIAAGTQQYNLTKTAKTTILVVEDDPDTLDAITELLTRGGYKIIAAVDGQDAVEKFAEYKDEIKLVISDVVMPRKSGKVASNEIRQISGTTKFIFVSGHAKGVIAREGILIPDAELIMKPIMPFELLDKIRELLK